MFKTLKNAWRQPELRNKLLFTALIIILYRLGSSIPVPYFNLAAADASIFKGNILEFLSILSGGALAQGTLLALGVSPYITASIVMHLLTVAIPKLGEIAKRGEDGKIRGIDDMIAGLKTQFPNQFENAGTTTTVEPQPLPHTEPGGTMSRSEFLRKPYAERAAYAKENPDAYREMMKN